MQKLRLSGRPTPLLANRADRGRSDGSSGAIVVLEHTAASDERPSNGRMWANICIVGRMRKGRFDYRRAHLPSHGDTHIARLDERPAKRG
jgi:hypothetical protein